MPYNQITTAGTIAPGTAPKGPNAKQIRDLIYNNLNANGFTFTWVSKNKQPYKGVLNAGGEPINLSIYAWRICDGGRIRLGRVSEKRIQISHNTDRSAFTLPMTDTQKTLLLGVYDSPHGEPIFSAWNATNNDLQRYSQKSEWVQVEDLQKAIKYGIIQFKDSGGNVGYTFLPSYLGDYIDLVTNGNDLTVSSSKTVSLKAKVKTATKAHKKARIIRTTDEILNNISKLDETERSALTKQRIGQGYFKELLLNKYGCKCALCSISTESMLIASHIKRWTDCNNSEKLDEANGLLLCAHHDALFDKHLISFDNTGKPVISSTLSAAEQSELQISSIPSITVDTKMIPYLTDHRSKLKK